MQNTEYLDILNLSKVEQKEVESIQEVEPAKKGFNWLEVVLLLAILGGVAMTFYTLLKHDKKVMLSLSEVAEMIQV